MANRKATPTEEVSGNPWNEFIAITLLALGLLFLAMISYSPGDLPSWLSFSSKDVQNNPVRNIIGPLGALVAGFAHFLFGAPAYAIPAVFIWFGVAKLLSRMAITWRHLLGFGLFMLAGCCLMEYQTWFLKGWKNEFNVLSSGGCVGWFVGGQLLAGVIGTGGAFLVMSLVYIIGLVLLSGFLPVSFFVVCRDTALGLVHQIQARKGLALVSGRDDDSESELKRIEREERRLQKERSRIEKKLTGVGEVPAPLAKRTTRTITPSETAEEERVKQDFFDDQEEIDDADVEIDEGFDPAPELPLPPDTPEPKIIDSSVRDNGKKKLSLAEWRQHRDEKRDGGPEGAEEVRRSKSTLGLAFKDYELPELLDLLEFEEEDESRKPADVALLRSTQDTIIRTLASFGVHVSAGDITRVTNDYALRNLSMRGLAHQPNHGARGRHRPCHLRGTH